MTDLSGNFTFDCQKELERKTFETLELLEQQYRTGRLSESAYRGALQGVNGCTRGLVPESYSLSVDQEVSLLPSKDMRTSVWASNAAVYILSMEVGEDYFVVRTIPAKDGKRIVRGEGTDPVANALSRFRSFESKLEANGYKKL